MYMVNIFSCILLIPLFFLPNSSSTAQNKNVVHGSTIRNISGDDFDEDEDGQVNQAQTVLSGRWPKDTIPYEISGKFIDKERLLIVSMMERIQNVSCVRFVERTDEKTFMEVEQGSSHKPCSSKIGYKDNGARIVYLQHDCMDVNGVLHELMHVMGFEHEHTRYDRDNYVTIIKSNIRKEYYVRNFKKRDYLEFLYFNMSYDFTSVLHYPVYNDFAINKSLPTIETYGNEIKAVGMSRLDIQKINDFYDCGKGKNIQRILSPTICGNGTNNETYDVESNLENSTTDVSLHWSPSTEVMNKIISLLSNGTSISINAKDEFGYTLMHLAAAEGKTAIVRHLSQCNRNLVNVMNNMKQTPLHLSAGYGHQFTVLYLLENGANINAKATKSTDPNGTVPSLTPLHFASKLGHFEAVRVLLCKMADVYCKDNAGDTPIHLAAKEGKKSVVNLLLEHDIRLVDVKNAAHQTPLHTATINGHAETVLALLDKGANINGKINPDGTTALHIAAMLGHKETVKVLLCKNADVHAENSEGDTPIHLASSTGNMNVVDMLLDIDVRLINVTGQYKYTPLHMAAFKAHPDTILTLLKNGADVNAKVNDIEDPIERDPHVTALHLAAVFANNETITTLLRNHANVYAKDYDGRTPLHYAALRGKTTNVNVLLEFNVNLTLTTDNSNNTPLHLATLHGHHETVLALLDNGADVDAKANYDNEPNGTEPSVSALHFAAKAGQIKIVQTLLNYSADIHAKDQSGYTPLHLAAFTGKSSIVKILLEHNDTLIKATNRFRHIPLHIASAYGHLDTVLVLLEKGSNVHAKADCHDCAPGSSEPVLTPLHFAAIQGHAEVVRALLVNKANPYNKIIFGYTPIHSAANNGHTATVKVLLEFYPNLTNALNDWKYTPLHRAAWRGHNDVVSALLDKGANVNAKSNYLEELPSAVPTVTAMHLAAKAGHAETIRTLISRAADPTAKDNDGNTVIHIAAVEGKSACVQVLLDFNANMVHYQNKLNNTPLHLAVWKSHNETVILLLQKNADLRVKNYYDFTPLDMAQHFNNKGLADLLKRSGAASSSG